MGLRPLKGLIRLRFVRLSFVRLVHRGNFGYKICVFISLYEYQLEGNGALAAGICESYPGTGCGPGGALDAVG